MNSKLINHFLSHRAVTLELIAKMQHDNPEFKPAETSMTTEKLITHMLTSMYKFTAVVKAGNAQPLMQEAEITETNLLKLAELYTEKTVQILESLTEEDLNQVIDLTGVFGFKVPGSALIKMGIEHEVNHKGNLFVYARILGHTELPMYVKKI
ncbi:DinB family protein [Bacillus sp. F19]|nr:DinB family protein [Bacillus sp. F19]